jgi:cation diffusion facilitator CzcD-associated flavoprotein CzcO
MHSLGFRFEPWVHEKAIADGAAILEYLHRVVAERRIDRHIRFGTKVVSADWRSGEALWHLTVEDGLGSHELMARFLYLASGYYDYDDPHDAKLPGLDRFEGAVIHPAMADKAAHVTMLQRTPTWMAARPSRDAVANRLQRWLPGWLAHWITREKNIRMGRHFFNKARGEPDAVGAYLTRKLREGLGDAYSEEHFKPPYGPWQQRLCLVPDNDFFEAVKAGKAAIVTGHIESFEKQGARLKDGRVLPADVVVTATGLRLALGGKIAVSLEGQPVDWKDHWFYRGCMFSNVPNLAVVFGYLNASWTLRADNTADYICRVLNRMSDKRADVVLPYLPTDHDLTEDDIVVFSSGYLQRAKPLMPKSAAELPWRLNQDYSEDCRDFRKRPVDDGVLRFDKLPGRSKAA